MVVAFVERHADLNHPQHWTLPWGAGHHNQGSGPVGPEGPVTLPHCPPECPSPQANLNASILNIMQQMRVRARNSVGNDERYQRIQRYLNLVTRDSHFFSAKKKCPNCWLNSLRHPGSEVMLERVRGCPRQESETLRVMLQIPYGVPMRVAYSYVFELTMRCLLGDDQYAS